MTSRRFKFTLLIVLVLCLVTIIVIGGKAPNSFPEKMISVSVPKNSSLNSTADNLYSKKIISSTFLFKVFSVLLGGSSGIRAGDYRFSEPQNVWTVAYRIVKGQEGQAKISVTIPEGTNVYDMAYIFLTKFPDFNSSRFVSLALEHEGYLFPDTYFFFANVTPEEIIDTMKDRFDDKIKTVRSQISSFDKSLSEIINMAAIVEKETRADESRKIVAGILWKRLEKGMPLQVDAPFYYITAKRGNFTPDDLKIDSPYNTYKYKGLPKGPISNPGLETIIDTINPTDTPYWFYLTDEKGEMRYAENYDKHLANINKYLR